MLKIVKASAGSGKTYTLVKEYLRLALRHPTQHFKHILAITFTNKAANEMKERVLQKLNALAALSDKENHLIEFLCTELQISQPVLQQRCQQMLQAMLHNYADIAISTIDSFTHQVIRGFAYELKLNMNVEIEMDTDAFLTQVVELLLDEIEDENNLQDNIERKNLSKALIEFASTKMDAEKSWRIEKDLLDFSKNLLKDETFMHRETLEKTSIPALLELQKNLQKFIHDFETKTKQIAHTALELITTKGLTAEDFYQKKNSIVSYFKGIVEKGGSYENAATGSSHHQKTIAENKWAAGNKENPTINAIKNDLTQLFAQLTSLYTNDYPEVALAKLINKNIFPFMLLQALNRVMQSYKADNGLMLIGEFQHKVFSEVKDQPVPVIFERVGSKFDNIMIDEFQDTSVMQWHNLLPLIDNAVANMNECLIVGDAKQAIYRFRGGEVKQFSMLPDIYGSDTDWVLKEREINIKNHSPRIENLAFNYRSRANIIAFNNSFYEMAKKLPELVDKATYHQHEQKTTEQTLIGGNVIMAFIENKKEEAVSEQFQQTLDFVKDAQSRNYNQRDIAILVEKNKTGAQLASFLIEQGYNVVSPESLLIAEADSVKLLECALMYLNRSDDYITRAELWLSLSHKFQGNIAVSELQVYGNKTAFEEKISAIIAKQFNSFVLNELKLFDLLNRLITLFDLNISSDPFVQFFLDEVLLYTQKFSGSIQHFLDWWNGEKESKSIIYPETLDAIRVMTVHKSKGLEFPVVILPDADYSTSFRDKHKWVEIEKPYCKGIHDFLLPLEQSLTKTSLSEIYEQEKSDMFLEKLNLLYVATTRPTDLLYIISVKAKETKEKKERSINNLQQLFTLFAEQQHLLRDNENLIHFFNHHTTKVAPDKPSEVSLFKIDETIASSGISVLKVRQNPRLLWKQSKLNHIAYGNLLHKILSEIHYASDAEKVIAHFAQKEFLTENDITSIKRDVVNIVNHIELKELFTPPYKVFNETAICINGNLKYPDRVVVNTAENSIAIIDYKTGDETSAHGLQIKEYKNAFEHLGFEVKKAIVFYTQNNHLIDFAK
jgi:ATP-dependent exoDNAse (exonuclease V) beta subunit